MAQKINLDLVAAGACPEVSYLAQGKNKFPWGLLTPQTRRDRCVLLSATAGKLPVQPQPFYSALVSGDSRSLP